MRSVINQLKCLVAILCLPISIDAQDYFGIGNTNGVSTSASSTYQDPRWDESAIAFNTLNAKGFIAERYDAARFLTQATLGFGQFNIDEVVSLGKEGWVDDQFTKGPNRVLPKMNEIISAIESANGGDIDPNFVYFNYAWWSRIMSNNDLLRHRIAVALSEILVISRNSTLSDDGEALASYYDVLYDNAFGNYKDILMEVTYHPAMGDYLDHLNNPKSDPSNDQFPDENYAREILQLFSIGLFELNTNGTRKKANGEDIPTYDNDDILEYAKVFTGLSFSALQSHQTGSIRFGRTNGDWTVPMRMFEDEHEPGQKRLLRGQVVPAGQTGDEDIEDAITGLFNHPNVGPFLAYRLIQRLTTSNPSNGYVSRVAQKFNNNGSGVRGDMKAVIKAILLDNEVQNCDAYKNENLSKLKEPIIRYTQFARAVDKTTVDGRLWNHQYDLSSDIGQDILSSPSVFNFFLPIDVPNGPIEDNGYVAPEFKLHDTRLGAGYINEAYDWTNSGRIMRYNQGANFDDDVYWNMNPLLNLAEDVEVYINWLDQNITHGQLNDNTRNLMRDALNQIDVSRNNYLLDRVKLGMYFALISSDYSVIK